MCKIEKLADSRRVFALTDEKTLKHKKADNIYVLGDNTNVPTSKAGSVAHFEAEIIEKNLMREINGEEPTADFDGYSNCFIESGFHKALLFDFNYDTEPLPGTFPLSKIGPFSLLKETKLNHRKKDGIQIYLLEPVVNRPFAGRSTLSVAHKLPREGYIDS